MLIKGRVEKTHLSEHVLTHFDKTLDLLGRILREIASQFVSINGRKDHGSWTVQTSQESLVVKETETKTCSFPRCMKS